MKRKLLITIALLAGLAASAQAQALYDVRGVGVKAREGGAAELAGSVVLFKQSGEHADGVVTIVFSAPLAKGTEPMATTGATPSNPDKDDEEDGKVTVTLTGSAEDVTVLSNVRLDLRESDSPVTATVTGDKNAIVTGVVTVVSAIEEAMTVKGKSVEVLTRGGTKMTTVTLEESFSSAWSTDAMVVLKVSGVPDNADLTIEHVYPTAAQISAAVADGETEEDAAMEIADIAGVVTLTVGADSGEVIIDDGAATENDLMVTGTGKDIEVEISFSPASDDTTLKATAKDSLMLVFTLAATKDQKDLKLPLSAGMVKVTATMAPEKEGDREDVTVDGSAAGKGAYFTPVYIPSADGLQVFSFMPASCTLLFPYAVALGDLGWNTGIAVTNPTAHLATSLNGAVHFTLYPNDLMDGDDPPTYSTGPGTPNGTGTLDEDGLLPAGKTYTLLLTELAAWAGREEEDFTGHLYVKTDFTDCEGVGWVTDFGTVNQAYVAREVDDETLN